MSEGSNWTPNSIHDLNLTLKRIADALERATPAREDVEPVGKVPGITVFRRLVASATDGLDNYAEYNEYAIGGEEAGRWLTKGEAESLLARAERAERELAAVAQNARIYLEERDEARRNLVCRTADRDAARERSDAVCASAEKLRERRLRIAQGRRPSASRPGCPRPGG